MSKNRKIYLSKNTVPATFQISVLSILKIRAFYMYTRWDESSRVLWNCRKCGKSCIIKPKSRMESWVLKQDGGQIGLRERYGVLLVFYLVVFDIFSWVETIFVSVIDISSIFCVNACKAKSLVFGPSFEM